MRFPDTILPASAAAVLLLALTAGPPASQPASASRSVAVATVRATAERDLSGSGGPGVVTLITGDRVRLTSYPDGRTAATVLPGSPHFGQPATAVHTDRADYVMPRLPVGIGSRFDTSLFDVTALAELGGTTVPVAVEFNPGLAPHQVPGLTLDFRSAHETAHGGTVVDGAYRATPLGVRPLTESRWRGVRRVWLPTDRPAAPPTGTEVHTLTVNLVDAHGNPVAYDQVLLMNLDDPRLFNQPVDLVDGTVDVQVPEGNYSVFTGVEHFAIVVKPDVNVRSDRTISVSLGDATVTPAESLPGYHRIDSGVTVTRVAEGRGSTALTLLGGQRFGRVQPASADQPHGELWVTVDASLARKGDDGGCDGPSGGGCVPLYRTLSATEDFRAGIPENLSFRHTEADFAVVKQRLYANGSAVNTFGDIYAVAPFDVFGFSSSDLVHLPSIRVVRLQASDVLRWYQEVAPIEPLRCCSNKMAVLYVGRRYPSPGPAPTVSFAHAPVGPGVEAAYDHTNTGPRCSLCRSGDKIRGSLPLFSGAGTGMNGQLGTTNMGGWTLRQASHPLAGGHYFIRPRVTLPPQRQRYTLTASSQPGVRVWRLSTQVRDTWRFSSGHGTAVLPLLMASYVPPTDLTGSMRAGRTSYRLDFGNLGSADGYVRRATLSFSVDDGKSWQQAQIRRLDRNSFRVSYDNPTPSGRHDYVSLRATGVDRGGRSVVETAVRAYRLLYWAGN